MKVAIVVLAGTETHEGLGRIVNAFETAKEFKQAGDEVTVVFGGSGVQGLAEISNPTHKSHPLYTAVKDKVASACSFCATVFGVRSKLERADIPCLDEYDNHPSLRQLVQAD